MIKVESLMPSSRRSAVAQLLHPVHLQQSGLKAKRSVSHVAGAGNSCFIVKSGVLALHGKPSQSYGASLAVWDHIVLPATRHKWMLPVLTLVCGQLGRYSIYLPWRDEGWASLITVRLGIEPATTWSQVQHPNRYAVKPPVTSILRVMYLVVAV